MNPYFEESNAISAAYVQQKTNEYREHFMAAMDMGRRNGFAVRPLPDVAPALALSPEMRGQIQMLMHRMLPDKNVLAAMCAQISTFTREAMEHAFSIPAYVTIGAVKFNSRWGCEISEDDVTKWLRDGIPSPMTNVHAWLTLASMEIIDFTFLYTMKVTNAAAVLLAQGETDDIEYRPILVAEDFVERFKLGMY